MADPQRDGDGHDNPGSRRAVGVYDRPASADRARYVRIVVIVVAVVVSMGGLYMYLT